MAARGSVSNSAIKRRRLGPALILAATLSILGGMPAECPAAESDLPVSIQVPLIMKILTYERNLMNLHAPTLHMGFLYVPEEEESRACFESFRTELARFAGRTVGGHEILLVPFPVAAGDSLRWPAGEKSPEILYVAPGNEERIHAICRQSRARKVLTVTAVERYVEAGLCAAVVLRGDRRTGVTINLAASREEGRDWVAEFLRLCKIRR